MVGNREIQERVDLPPRERETQRPDHKVLNENGPCEYLATATSATARYVLGGHALKHHRRLQLEDNVPPIPRDPGYYFEYNELYQTNDAQLLNEIFRKHSLFVIHGADQAGPLKQLQQKFEDRRSKVNQFIEQGGFAKPPTQQGLEVVGAAASGKTSAISALATRIPGSWYIAGKNKEHLVACTTRTCDWDMGHSTAQEFVRYEDILGPFRRLLEFQIFKTRERYILEEIASILAPLGGFPIETGLNIVRFPGLAYSLQQPDEYLIVTPTDPRLSPFFPNRRLVTSLISQESLHIRAADQAGNTGNYEYHSIRTDPFSVHDELIEWWKYLLSQGEYPPGVPVQAIDTTSIQGTQQDIARIIEQISPQRREIRMVEIDSRTRALIPGVIPGVVMAHFAYNDLLTTVQSSEENQILAAQQAAEIEAEKDYIQDIMTRRPLSANDVSNYNEIISHLEQCAKRLLAAAEGKIIQ